MATKTESWRAVDGTLHPNERSATEYEVGLLALKMNGPGPIASRLADLLAEHAEEIVRVVGAYAKCHLAGKRLNESSAPSATPGPVKQGPGFTEPADEAALAGHLHYCKARASGLFADCNCHPKVREGSPVATFTDPSFHEAAETHGDCS